MDLKKAKARLERERVRLEELRRGVRGDLMNEDPNGGESVRDAVSELSMQDQHPADMGTEMFEQEKNHSILSSLEAELQDVDRALERVAEGTYGTCEACRKPIPAARLEALPAARYCLDDQSKVEREARAS